MYFGVSQQTIALVVWFHLLAFSVEFSISHYMYIVHHFIATPPPLIPPTDAAGQFFLSILTFVILYNNLIPISLIVTLEVSMPHPLPHPLKTPHHLTGTQVRTVLLHKLGKPAATVL